MLVLFQVSFLIVLGTLGVFNLVESRRSIVDNSADRSQAAFLRRIIRSQVDCFETFNQAGIDPKAPGTTCTATTENVSIASPTLRLVRITANGTIKHLMGSLDPGGDGRVGKNALLRVGCSESERSLIVRMNYKTTGFDQQRSVLFGKDNPLCNDLF